MMADITIGDDKYEEVCFISNEFTGKSKNQKCLPNEEEGNLIMCRDGPDRYRDDILVPTKFS
jgi:hypothetical protein